MLISLRILIISGSQTEKRGAKRVAEELEKYDPSNDPSISGDPYKTLLVARVNYETTESRIKREFEAYGPIKRHVISLESGYNINIQPSFTLQLSQSLRHMDDITSSSAPCPMIQHLRVAYG